MSQRWKYLEVEIKIKGEYLYNQYMFIFNAKMTHICTKIQIR